MSLVFKPTGSLNISTDPSELPESASQFDVTSGAMVRCKNLRINQLGIAKTRDGSAALNESAIATPIYWIEEQGGTRYAFAGTHIYSNESSIASGLTSAQWAAIKYNAFNDTAQNVFALNGTNRKRIESGTVYEWGIEAPTVAPTLASGQGNSLTGEYNVRYTYARKVGSTVVSESNPSPAASQTIVLASESLSISVTQPTDPQVTHIRIYRTFAGADSGYFYDQDVAINSSYAYAISHSWEDDYGYLTGTSFQFTTADATNSTDDCFSWEARASELTTEITTGVYSQPFDTADSFVLDGELGDELAEDHDRPPLGSYVIGPAYDGTCFIIKDNLLYYCKPKQPEYWPSTYYVEVSAPQFPGTTAVFHNGQPYYFTSTEIYYVQGTGHGTFFPLPMKAKTGAQSARGAVSVAGKGIYHTGPDGIYLYASGSDIKITEDSLEPIFRGEDTQDIPGVADMSTAWLIAVGSQLYFGYRSEGFTYPTNVLVMNFETSRVSYFAYDDGSPIEISAPVLDLTNDRFLIGDYTGFIRVIEDSAYEDDSDEPVNWEIQSKDFILATRKHFPRWNKYDVDASSADTCTGEILLAGEVHHSHTITGNRDTRRRLVGVGNGNRAALRISGTGPVSIYGIESE